MEFLKELFSDKALTYEEFAQAVNAHNGNEANKDNQIKIGNLGKGEYVSTGKYNALQDSLNGKDAELANANNLIAELKKASKGNEEMQQKFTQYETENARLQQELQEAEIKYAFEVMLMDAGVTDKDEREFLTYKYEKKLKEEGKSLELDDNKHIKGSDAIIESLKTTNPKPFESSKGRDAYQVLGDNRLPGSDGNEILTKSDLLKKPYAERMKIFNENPEAYNTAMKS